MQQMQPVPPQQGGKKKYSKGRKGRKGGNLFEMNPQQPVHQQLSIVHQQPPRTKTSMYCKSKISAAHKVVNKASLKNFGHKGEKMHICCFTIGH